MAKTGFVTVVWHAGSGTFFNTDDCEILVLTDAQYDEMLDTGAADDSVMKVRLEDVIDENKLT